MQETTGEFSGADELLAAIHEQGVAGQAESRPPFLYAPESLQRHVAPLARPGETADEYALKLGTQRHEGLALARHFRTVETPADFGVATEALGKWSAAAIDTPNVPGMNDEALIDNQAMAQSLMLTSARLIHTHPDDKDLVLEKTMPFFNEEQDGQQQALLAKTMVGLADKFTTANGIEQMRAHRYERAAVSVLTEATGRGYIPPDFWYHSGVRSANGQLRFATAEGIYNVVVRRGIDIRPGGTSKERQWDDTANFCQEVVASLDHDHTRNKQNIRALQALMQRQRGRGSKYLSPVAIIKIANAVTGEVNKSERKFGPDYDKSGAAGPLEPLDENDVASLGEAVRRMLYITRDATATEGVARRQRYEDAIYKGAVEGLVGLQALPAQARKVGKAAVGGPAPQQAYKGARTAALRPNRVDWKRREPGAGVMS